MWYVVSAIVSLAVGYLYRDLRDAVKVLQKKLPQDNEIGATPASYGPVKGYTDSDKDIGLVSPKTPQQLEFEENERLKKMQY